MHKGGKFSNNGRARQKYCCPLKKSKYASCPCDHKYLNTMAHITLLAVASAAVITKSQLSYRNLKSVKRIA